MFIEVLQIVFLKWGMCHGYHFYSQSKDIEMGISYQINTAVNITTVDINEIW
jgi:hypothetical protein